MWTIQLKKRKIQALTLQHINLAVATGVWNIKDFNVWGLVIIILNSILETNSSKNLQILANWIQIYSEKKLLLLG